MRRPALRAITHILLVALFATGLVLTRMPPAGAGGSFTFAGSGWGHRLGLSQYGAYGQALEGRGWGQIIHSYYGAGVGAIPTSLPGSMRVGISQNQSGANISGSGGAYTIGAGDMRWPATSGTWKINPTSSGMRVTAPGGEFWDVGVGSAWVSGFEESGTVITLAQNGKRYGRGWIDVVRKSGTSVNIVVETTYDKYLYGLGEMPSSWPAAALQAQAVAARTYAYYKHATSGDRRSSCDCTVHASTVDQAYVGWDKESGSYGSSWVAAVDYTASITILSSGAPILALYHSSSGGRTDANEDVWGGSALHYLRPMPDSWSHYSPHASWTATFSSRDLGAKVGLDDVTSVDLSERTMGGGVASAVFYGTSGGRSATKTLSGSTFRSVLGLRSTMVDVSRPRGFDQWLLLLNPNESAVAATVAFERVGAQPVSSSYTLPAKSRTTIKVNNFVSAGDISVRVSASMPIVAERALYFVYGSWDGGASSEGAKTPRNTWILAEGYQGRSFDTFVEVYNPQSQQSAATIDFLLEGGGVISVPVTIPAKGRTTLPVYGVAGLHLASFSIRVQADQPVVAERSSYFKYRSPAGWGSAMGGSAAIGESEARTSWDLAEGHSGPNFDTWTLVTNPGSTPVNVTARYLTDDGKTVTQQFQVPANARQTTLARSVPGLTGHSHSVHIESSGPVVAERAMYFQYGGIADGHGAQATPAPGTRWYLAEGYAGPGFDTWVLISNPGSQTAAVKVSALIDGGGSIVKDISVEPGSRRTINLRDLAGPISASTVVESTNGVGIVAERASYFTYESGRGWSATGGSDSMGVSEASSTWYFAEGYVS